ncbi:hypothetical protein AAFF27_10235 [Xylophilus sp. GW821-FHT01B05]
MKHVLRDEGLTADTWDREQHGVFIRRKKFERAIFRHANNRGNTCK